MADEVEPAIILDPFQVEAIGHLDAGRSVVVAAPTGSGKTIVAEHAIALAIEAGEKAFYTTPIKALSNQKYHDFARRWGPERVGLLTGDTSINGDADIVVMTTEVLRNMLYGRSRVLRRLGCVVLDEVHFLQDPYRGPVWEEIIVHSPDDVRLVCLSATVSNADELTEWICTVRGSTELIVEYTRPVELTNLYLVADRHDGRLKMIPTLVSGGANPDGHRFTRRERNRNGSNRQRSRYTAPRRRETVERLIDAGLLPAIVFIFSRAGCSDAAAKLVSEGVDLTSAEERSRIDSIIDARTGHLSAQELAALQFDRFRRGLERGVAAHHAGMVPVFKETVEQCFVEGLVKVVFATETLALGINMPARAVVIEKLTKFNGESHQFLTPLEYTQLTGRAGRRGIDDQGFAIVPWSPFVTFEQVADLASSRSFELKSVFRPTYNMAANLVALHDRDGAHRLLDRSFGQFQADAEIARLDKRRSRLEREIAALQNDTSTAGAEPEVVTEGGGESVPDQGSDSLHREVAAMLSALRPGEIIAAPDRSEREPAVVLSIAYRRGGAIKVAMVTRSHRRLSAGIDDFVEVPSVLGRIELPDPYAPSDGAFIHEVVQRLARTRVRRRRGRPSSAPMSVSPSGISSGPDPRRQLADKRRSLVAVEHRIAGRASRLARQFDDIVGILGTLGYVADWDLTPKGEVLRGVFHESDLLIAQSITRGLFDDLGPPELAAVTAYFTYEHRGPEPGSPPRLRSRSLRERVAGIDTFAAELRAIESEAGVRQTRELDPGFMGTAAAWADGDDLAAVLDDDEITGGDFVRQIRQLIDLCRQIGAVAPDPNTRSVAIRAAEALNRGVIVATNVEPADEAER